MPNVTSMGGLRKWLGKVFGTESGSETGPDDDRRAGSDRRTGDDRRASFGAPRRASDERRDGSDRRTGEDRRNTP